MKKMLFVCIVLLLAAVILSAGCVSTPADPITPTSTGTATPTIIETTIPTNIPSTPVPTVTTGSTTPKHTAVPTVDEVNLIVVKHYTVTNETMTLDITTNEIAKTAEFVITYSDDTYNKEMFEFLSKMLANMIMNKMNDYLQNAKDNNGAPIDLTGFTVTKVTVQTNINGQHYEHIVTN